MGIDMNIRDIAKKAEVSVATVSRVINKNKNVSEKTRKKVELVIEKYGFVPNNVARSLSTNNNYTVAVIVSDITNEFFLGIIRGVQEIAEKNGYNLLLFDSSESVEREEKFLGIVHALRLQGVIITPVREDNKKTHDQLLKLKEMNIPVVLVDREINDADFDGVFIDNYEASREAVTSLVKAGHEKIAIITGPESSLPGRMRLNGYKAALKAAKIPLKDDYIFMGDFRLEKAFEGMEYFLNLENPPTAVFTSNNLSTLGALKSIISRKLVIGKDISILSFDQIEAFRIINYRLSAVERVTEMQGNEAMKLLIRRLSEGHQGEDTIKEYVPYKLILRGSETLK